MTSLAAPTAVRRGRVVAPALLTLTALAALLRLPLLESQSMTYDETFTRAIVGQGWLGDLLSQVKATEATPPLGYVIGWAWTHLVGSTSDAAVRTVPAVAGVLVVPAAFFALRRWVGERIALATAALAAVSPILVSYSLIARSYMVAVLLGVLSLWALGALVERPTVRRLALWALACAAALWTHYYVLFLVLGEIAVLLWLLEGWRARVIGASALVGLSMLPLLPLLADQTDGRSDNIGSFSLGDRIEQTVRNFGMGSNAPGAPLEGIGLLLAGAGFAAGAWILWRRGGLARAAVLIAIGVPLGSLLLDVAGIENHFFMRNLLPVWVCVGAVAAAGLLRLRGVPLAAYLVVCVVAVLIVNTDWRYQNAADWRGARDAIPGRGVPVLVYPAFAERVAVRYLGGRPSPGTVTRELTVVVEPGRSGRRDLRPLPEFPRGGIPGFTLRGQEVRDGMRILYFRAAQPVQVTPAALAPDVLGAPPRLLVSAPDAPLRGE
jgi:4-amino-4-deoxy-L-arabinose transferase-like glycosyltransferase